MKRKKTVLGSLVLGSRRRLGPSFESFGLDWRGDLIRVLAIPVLGLPLGDLGRLFSFLLQVLKTWCLVCSYCSPFLFGGSELLVLFAVLGALFPPRSCGW